MNRDNMITELKMEALYLHNMAGELAKAGYESTSYDMKRAAVIIERLLEGNVEAAYASMTAEVLA